MIELLLAFYIREVFMIDLTKITTERRNPASTDIDKCSTLEMLRIINKEDQKVALAVERILPQIAEAVDVIAAHLRAGGRLFYLGAGTSGRLGILDAAECPPTYGTDPSLVIGVIAGGTPAIFRAQEGAEDDPAGAVRDLKSYDFCANDVLVGIAASGRTPYVIGGLRYAKEIGAPAIALTCSENAPVSREADIALAAVTGPEVVTGSTRMKAGTAQKLVLNMLSTGAMIRLGKVYGNLMVDVKSSNEKLTERAQRIVTAATGCTYEEAQDALAKSDGQAKLAILIQASGCTAERGRKLLAEHEGRLAAALAASGRE